MSIGSGASPLVAAAALPFFLPFTGFATSCAGSAAGTSSSEKKSAACLRVGLALAGLVSEDVGTALAAFAGFGAEMSSDFLAFFAFGADSGAPVTVISL